MQKKKLVMATANAGKIREIKAQLGEQYEFLSLPDIGCLEDIPEEQDSLQGNALQKAQYVWDHYGYPCFSEDTGLEVAALNGAPGVYTARYAGPQKDPNDNMDLLLKELAQAQDRSAQFRTVICLYLGPDDIHYFEGIAPGQIAPQRLGEKGFGYDPIFVPQGHQRSFAQMSLAEKQTLSHRGQAVRQLSQFLAQL
ncbi:non-canonical purine NTP pyrophosphatase, rdgB/HAM1 family [Saprospira grandis DSM 2844]|uniref:dITP/XTP pyrophosphatase n=1 Tax=Saprospira grandis DSM 2844 TaxID=694433 RepID=J0XVF0_9BACT|nr:RdgB/HAM1 family non-canonical purine NTP pyrophosphatase [Saprospira grandis]EJF52991.1 non-canonical purine NTP pyrophosphatase, rdgB/HAM1 family [Saprospira grandis DSM 2844]